MYIYVCRRACIHVCIHTCTHPRCTDGVAARYSPLSSELLSSLTHSWGGCTLLSPLSCELLSSLTHSWGGCTPLSPLLFHSILASPLSLTTLPSPLTLTPLLSHSWGGCTLKRRVAFSTTLLVHSALLSSLLSFGGKESKRPDSSPLASHETTTLSLSPLMNYTLSPLMNYSPLSSHELLSSLLS
jgi:hypothetical protein